MKRREKEREKDSNGRTGEGMRELEEKEGTESTSERDKSTRKSGGYVRVNVIKGRDR